MLFMRLSSSRHTSCVIWSSKSKVNILKIIVIVIFLATFLNSHISLGAENKHIAIEFESHAINLAGTLVLPVDRKVYAAVVFVHGSGKQKRNIYWAEQFASYGIAALVYDKRGVGESGGKYESQQSVSGANINLLADDAVAALHALAQKLPNSDAIPLGLTGISQAGWIVPIAVEKTSKADFMLLWSGPVCKVSEEDIFSKYTRDKDSEQNPSFATALAARKTPYIWPDFLGTDSDPSTSLANIDIPGLWIFGEKDGSIPVDLSIERLQMLNNSGKKFEYVLFSHQGHNNMPASFGTAVDWIKARH